LKAEGAASGTLDLFIAGRRQAQAIIRRVGLAARVKINGLKHRKEPPSRRITTGMARRGHICSYRVYTICNCTCAVPAPRPASSRRRAVFYGRPCSRCFRRAWTALPCLPSLQHSFLSGARGKRLRARRGFVVEKAPAAGCVFSPVIAPSVSSGANSFSPPGAGAGWKGSPYPRHREGCSPVAIWKQNKLKRSIYHGKS
jgi:hypothetical protein